MKLTVDGNVEIMGYDLDDLGLVNTWVTGGSIPCPTNGTVYKAGTYTFPEKGIYLVYYAAGIQIPSNTTTYTFISVLDETGAEITASANLSTNAYGAFLNRACYRLVEITKPNTTYTFQIRLLGMTSTTSNVSSRGPWAGARVTRII